MKIDNNLMAPRPWKTDPELGDECILDANGVLVCDLSIFHQERSVEQNKYHAKLICDLINRE